MSVLPVRMSVIWPCRTGTINSVRASADTLTDHQKNWHARTALGTFLICLVLQGFGLVFEVQLLNRSATKSGIRREAAGSIASPSGWDLACVAGARVCERCDTRGEELREGSAPARVFSLSRISPYERLLYRLDGIHRKLFLIFCLVAPTIHWHAFIL